MDWYKSAKIESFRQRNEINARIQAFKSAIGILEYLKKYVYQNAPHAKQIALQIAGDKKMSSYPKAREILVQGAERALDNYYAFAQACEQAVDILYQAIKEMQEERSEFVQKFLPEQMLERK